MYPAHLVEKEEEALLDGEVKPERLAGLAQMCEGYPDRRETQGCLVETAVLE